MADIKRGDIVFDKEAKSDDLLVILTPNETIDNWYINDEEDITVADQNPDYDADEDAIVTVFVDGLTEELENWKDIDPKDLFNEVTDAGIPFYTFPKSRLEKHGLISNYDSMERYAESVRRNYRPEYFRSQSFTLEEPNTVNGVRVVRIEVNKAAVIFHAEDGQKVKKKHSEVS